MSWFNLEDIQNEINEGVQKSKQNPEFQRKVDEYIKNHPQPHCPICHSENLIKITTGEKIGNTLAFGIFGNKRKKQFKCQNCGYMF